MLIFVWLVIDLMIIEVVVGRVVSVFLFVMGEFILVGSLWDIIFWLVCFECDKGVSLVFRRLMV